MASRLNSKVALLIDATAKAASSATSVVETLEAFIAGQVTMSSAGRVTSTSEAGGSVTFAVPAGMDTGDMIDLAVAVLYDVRNASNPAAIDYMTLYRPRTRMRVSFAKASV